MKLNIFDPAQRAELIEVCSILASVTSMTPPQIFLAYTAYGDMFDWNIGKVLDNVDNVQGKLCLKPQAMLGNAYRLGHLEPPFLRKRQLKSARQRLIWDIAQTF